MRCNNRGYTVADASRDLGINKALLERSMRLGNTLFGYYVPPKENGVLGIYIVYRERVQAYIQAQDLKFQCPYAQQHIEGFGSLDMNTK